MSSDVPNTPQEAASGKPSPALIVFLLFPIIGIIAAVGVALSGGGLGGDTPPTPAPVSLPTSLPTVPPINLIDSAAPNFDLAGLDGELWRLSSYRGRVVFINFWATWCEPCQRELPAFEAFQAAQGDDGAIILAVNVGDDPNDVTAYFEQYEIGSLSVLMDFGLDVYQTYGIEQLPTTFVLDPAGVVRYKHIGEMTEQDLAEYVDLLGA